MKHTHHSQRRFAAIALLLGVFLLVFVVLFSPSPLKPKVKHYLKHEADFVNKWCSEKDGIIEHKLPDKTRIDCFLPEEFAAEFDWSDKWAESIGQSLHYAAASDAAPWVVLLRRKNTNRKIFLGHVAKIENIKNKYDLPIHIVCLNRQGDEIRC